MVMQFQWTEVVEAPPAPLTAPSGPFQACPVDWDDRTSVRVFAPGAPGGANLPAGVALRIWRTEVDHAAVRLLVVSLSPLV